MSFTKQALTALKRIFIVIGIAIAFTLGLLGAIYLSLRSSETKVPDIVGKDRMTAENTISSAGLNFRVRATRITSEAKPDTVLIQLPHAGEVVKVGQTVAVDLSRPSKDAETSTQTASSTKADNQNDTAASSASNSNTSASNSNEGKPRKKQANKNLNDNQNTNGNRNANRNRSTANRSGNENANQAGTVRFNVNANATPRANSNRSPSNTNSHRAPATLPTP